MANDLTIMRNGALPVGSAEDIERAKKHAAAITQGIGQPFGRVTYKQGKWGVMFQGLNEPLYRMIQEPNGTWTKLIEENLDCIIIDAAEHTSKSYYEKGYQPGSRERPDCWSTNGLQPDAGAPKRQSPTCAGCHWNKWGSRRATESNPNSRGKECSDRKHLVVVPHGDIENKSKGGPMLLQVPPSSLRRYKEYIDKLAEIGLLPNQVWTRLSFEEGSSYPLFVWDAMNKLTPDQKVRVDKVSKDPLVERILSSEVVVAEGWDDGEDLTVGGKPNGVEEPAPVEQPIQADGRPMPEPEPLVTGNMPEPEPEEVEEPVDEYTYSPDKTLRWKAGMANWEPVPKPAPPPLPPTPPPLPQGPPPLPEAKKATKRSKPPSPEPTPAPPPAPTPSVASTPTPSKNPIPGGASTGADPDVAATITAMVDRLT